jgi:hypothetical protein
MRRWERTSLGAYLASVLVLAGCGGNSTSPPLQRTTLAVQNGTWQVRVHTTYSGADSCLARPAASLDTTDVICSVSVVSGGSDFPFTCHMDTSGDNVTFDCSGRFDLGICWEIADINGSGTVTDTTFDINFVLSQRVTPKDPQNAQACELFYGRTVDDCSANVSSQGTWMNSGPTCSISGPASLAPGGEDSFTGLETLNGLQEAKYRWSITGQGVITGSDTSQTVSVRAANAGRLFLTLDVGRGCSGHTCVDTVAVTSAPPAAAQTLDARGGSAPVAAPAGRDSGQGTTPFSDLLPKLIRLALPRDGN